jgi:hypothetical protein
MGCSFRWKQLHYFCYICFIFRLLYQQAWNHPNCSFVLMSWLFLQMYSTRHHMMCVYRGHKVSTIALRCVLNAEGRPPSATREWVPIIHIASSFNSQLFIGWFIQLCWSIACKKWWLYRLKSHIILVYSCSIQEASLLLWQKLVSWFFNIVYFL